MYKSKWLFFFLFARFFLLVGDEHFAVFLAFLRVFLLYLQSQRTLLANIFEWAAFFLHFHTHDLRRWKVFLHLSSQNKNCRGSCRGLYSGNNQNKMQFSPKILTKMASINVFFHLSHYFFNILLLPFGSNRWGGANMTHLPSFSL